MSENYLYNKFKIKTWRLIQACHTSRIIVCYGPSVAQITGKHCGNLHTSTGLFSSFCCQLFVTCYHGDHNVAGQATSTFNNTNGHNNILSYSVKSCSILECRIRWSLLGRSEVWEWRYNPSFRRLSLPPSSGLVSHTADRSIKLHFILWPWNFQILYSVE
jgi:hypothetical protein